MPDAFDQHLERVLAEVADSLYPPQPPDPYAAGVLVDRLRRRRRRRVIRSSALVLPAVVVVAMVVGLSRPTSTSRRVNALGGHGTGTTTTTSTAATVTLNGAGAVVAPAGPVATTAPCSPSSCARPTLPPPRTLTTARVTTRPTVVPATTTTAPAPATTTTTIPSTGLVTVTEADSGATITLHLGQSVRIVLTGSSLDRWSPPMASDPSVLQGQPTGILPSVGSAVAQFGGVAVGHATVSATQDPTCREITPPCGQPSRLFTLTVVVAG